MFAGTFKGYNSLNDMQNVHLDLINKEFKIGAGGISEFTTANIQAKAATMGLKDSLITELVALGKDATFTQKAATGKLTFGKALKENIGTVEELVDVLKKSGKIDENNIEYLKDGLSKGNNVAKKRLEDIITTTEGLSDSIIDIGTVTPKTTGFLAGLEQTFTGIVATLKPLLPLMATAAAIFAAYQGFKWLDDKYTLTFDTAQKHLEESSSAYTATASEIESLNSKTADYKTTLESIGSKYNIEFSGIETIDEMINKIRSIDGKVDIADEATINKLERENSLLKTRKDILTSTATTQQKQAAEDARKSIEFASEETYLTDGDGNLIMWGNQIAKKQITREEYVREQIAEMEKAKKQIEEAQEKLDDDSISKKERKAYEKQFNQATKDLEKYKSLATEKLTELNEEAENFYDKETGLILKGYEDVANSINSVNDLFTSFDLSPAEKNLKQIESFFNGSKLSNDIKKQLVDAAKSGKSATDALHEMGITLNDLGITSEGKKAAFDNYFNGLIESAEEAQQAINSIDGSVDGVKAAFESENKDADWNSMAEYLKQAEEIYTKTGKVGTDDFKSAVQFISPEIINPDAEGFKYDADAYVAAWENGLREKFKRYFDSENPITSAMNFTNDIIDKGLASKAGDDVTWGFKTSAEAAKALGLSVEATEVAMRNLESYGAEFDDVMFSGEGLKRYESALSGIKSLRDSMEEGDTKKELNNLIEGWDSELAGYQNDLSTLTEDQIVKIEFQYDLASIRSEIESLQNDIESTGGDTKEWGSLNSKKRSLVDKLASQEGMSGATSDTGYQNTVEKLSSLSEKLKSEYKTLGEDGRREIQLQQSALLDLQSTYLEAFSNGQTVNWEDFLGSKQINEVIDKISQSTGLSKDQIGDLVGIKIDVDTSNAESKITGILSNDGKTIKMGVNASTEQIQAQLDKLQTGQTLLFHTEIDGELRNIEAVKNEDGTITYAANIDGVQSEVKPVLNQDGTVNYEISKNSFDEIQNSSSTEIEIPVNYKKDKRSFDELRNLDGTKIEIPAKVTTDSKTTEIKIEELKGKLDALEEPRHLLIEGEINSSKILSQLSLLSAGSTITFTANVDGIQSQIQALKNEDGSIVYTTNIDGVQTQISTVLNQDGTVNYTLGESPEEVPNADGKADFTLGKHPTTAPPIDGKANYSGIFPAHAPSLQGVVTYKADFSMVNSSAISKTVNIGKSAASSVTSKATGTLLPSHVNGTGYNVLNLKPAYTDGKISLSQDEQAVVNELGTESIIRDGRWMLLPGGMHVQSLKKGDIVLTVQQTKDLLNTGKTNGHARAYAEGTLGNAYANGWRLPSAVSNNSSSSSKKKSSSSSKKSNTSSASNNNNSSSDAADEFKETIDYIEMKIDRIERQIKNLERVAGSAYNTFSKRNTALRNQISSITEEISTQQAGYNRYIQQAESVSLAENYKSQVRSGTIDISTITDETLAENIKEYQEW